MSNRNKKEGAPIEDHMKVGEELRASMVKEKKVKEVDPRDSFRKFFIRIKDKLKLAPSMEAVLWKHLESTKNDKPELFAKGVEHFGYKINN